MPQEALTGSRSRWRMQALRNHCPWLLGRRGQKEIMQSTSLRPDWEREYTSWKFRQFPVICKKSTDHFTPGTSFTHTQYLALLGGTKGSALSLGSVTTAL